MDARPPLVGRVAELDAVRTALVAAERGEGSLLLLSGSAGIGKTRLLEAWLSEAETRGFVRIRGVGLLQSMILYHPWMEALEPLGMTHLLGAEPPPRLLGLFVLSRAGLPAARVERHGFSEDPALLGTMLGAVAEFIRDALARPEKKEPVGVLRVAEGPRGFCVLPSETFGLVAVVEGRETEIFLEELANLAAAIENACGAYLLEWDGDCQALQPAEEAMREFLSSGKYEGVDLATTGAARKLNVFENVLYGLRRRAQERPLMIVIDDLQWADSSSLALLHYLARNTASDRILLCGAYRREDETAREHLRDALGGIRGENLARELRLVPFESHLMLPLAESFVGPIEVGDEFLGLLARETEGNPFFVRETLRELVDSGTLRKDPDLGRMRLMTAADRLRIPARARDVVLARVGRVSREDREVLEAASVLGTRFGGDVLAKVLGEEPLTVLRSLNLLMRVNGVVQTEGQRWHFEHAFIREVIYETLSGDLRKEYHARAAAALENLGADTSEVGGHLYLARDPRATDFLLQAGDAAMARGAPGEAARFRSEALATVAGERGAQIMADIGEAEYDAGKFETAVGWFERAAIISPDRNLRIEMASRTARGLERLGKLQEAVVALDRERPGEADENRARARWRLAKAWICYRRLLYPEAEREASLALGDLAGRPDDVADFCDAWNTLGSLKYRAGDLREAARRFSTGLAEADSSGATYHSARLRLSMAHCELGMGNLNEALKLSEEAKRIAERTGNRLFVASALTVAASCRFCLGDFIGARTTAEAAARRFEEIGSHVRSAEPHSLAALCDMEAGQGDRAEIGARQALDISPEGDYTLAVRVNLAEILVSRGKLAEGAALAERAVREGREAGLGSLLMYALLVSGAAKARGGRYSDAEADFVEALEPATAERDAWMYAQGLRWFGEAKAASGMYEEGISLLVDARERFSQMGGVHELRKVAEAIDRAERDRQRADGP